MKIDAEVAHSAGTTSESESEVQRVGRWLASEWTNCPAFAQLRSLVFLNKWCMERPRRIATAQLMYVTLNQRCVFNFTGCGCVLTGSMDRGQAIRSYQPLAVVPIQPSVQHK